MVSRLEDLCGIQMAIELANRSELKNKISRLQDHDLYDSLWYDESEPWFKNLEKKVLDELEKLPFGLRRKIPIPVVIFCLTQSIEWAKFYNKEFDLPFDYSCSFLRSSFFTSKGILDEEKAAREILKDTELSPFLKFCIACHYCLSDVIPALWEQLPEDKRPKVENKVIWIRRPNEIWSSFFLGELQFMLENADDSFPLYKFKKTLDYNVFHRNCSNVAFKKCFEELNESEKEEALIFTRDKLRYLICKIGSFFRLKSNYMFPLQLFLPFQKYLEIVIFLLHHLDERQLKVFFQPVLLHYVLFHSLSWPYQHMFMGIVSQFWEVLPKSGFCLLLHQIVRLMKNKSSSQLCDYHNILRDFWVQSSPSLKRFFFRFEGINERDRLSMFHSDFERLGFSYVMCELFKSPFTIEDEKIIRLIFGSATLEEKSDIVSLQGNRIGEISFDACDLSRINLFIECCVPKERIESFKKEIFNDDDVKEKVLFSLVLDNKGKEFQKILNWAFSAEEVKEWLKKFVLYVWQEFKFHLYSPKIKCVDKSLEWALSSNEIKNLKRSLVLNVEDIAWHLISSSKVDFQDIDFFLEWIFSSDVEMLKFKKDLAFEMVRHLGELYFSIDLSVHDLSVHERVIKWSALSKEEGKDFKRQLAFQEKVIEYYSKLVAQSQLSEVDAFIQWAELTETEEKNFNRLLVFNVEGKIFSFCVSFILNGKRDFVKELANGTQSSKEEVRDFYSHLTKELNLYTQITEKNTKLNDIKEFFSGFPFSEDEIKRHKKDLLFKSIELIEYFVMENRWDEMEELLGWCFSSKIEIGEFKKNIPLKINDICLKLILWQRYDDADKFLTWTGVHESLKKELLKKGLFHRRIYQIVSWELNGVNNGRIEILLNFLSANDLSNKWKSSFLIWLYEYKNRSNCSDINCFKIRSPDYGRFSAQLDNRHLCDDCRSFIVDCKRFMKLFDEHNKKSKVGQKRELESSLQINSTETKRSRHC